MKLLNLNTIKIKDYNNINNVTIDREIQWGEEVLIHKLEEQLGEIIETLPLQEKTLYTFNFTCQELSAFAFEQLVDMTTMIFNRRISTTTRRDREYRLGVDLSLNCHIIPWILKNWINYKTNINIFNIRVTCGDWSGEMIRYYEIILY